LARRPSKAEQIYLKEDKQITNELIPIKTNEKQEPIVSGRDLHCFLEVETKYQDWIKRQLDYGFEENADYALISQLSQKREGSRLVTRELQDHVLKLDTAKEISMMQKNEKGKLARRYFIAVEKEYNSPEKIMARALKVADETINSLVLENKQQNQIILELQPKATYYDLILQNNSLLATTVIAKDYGMSATALNRLLHELGVQYNLSGTWLLYQKYADQGYTSSKTQNYNRSDGTQGSRLHTYWTQKGRLFIYELLKDEGILPLIERNYED